MKKTEVQPSRTLTFNDAVQIHMLLQQGELQSRIAARFDTNGGRISEIKTGKRFRGSFEIAIKKIKVS